jgi:pimeloyl-ACP methyl ester carboxylesterase
MSSTVAHSSHYFHGPRSVYYDRLTPVGEKRAATVVMIHGGAHNGSCWLVTPDDRPGWAYHFAQMGYSVVIPDWPGHGRSGQADPDELTGEQICEIFAAMLRHFAGPIILVTHSMSGPFGWRIAELSCDQINAMVAIAPGPPGNIQGVPAAVDDGECWTFSVAQRKLRLPKRGFLYSTFDLVEKKLIGESSHFPREHARAYISALSATATRLILERQNIDGSQVCVVSPSQFSGMPIMIVTGTHDIDHPKSVDQSIVEWFSEKGAIVTFEWLQDRGIEGNGHMLMIERNNIEIADIVLDWLNSISKRG